MCAAKENHWRGDFDDLIFITVRGFHPKRGFDPSIFYDLRKEGLVATKADVMEARRVTVRYQIENPDHDILLTIQDSRKVPDNARNAPLDATGGFEYYNHRGHGILHKKKYPEPPRGLYDWEPWTKEERDKMIEEERVKMSMEMKAEKKLMRQEKKAKRRR